MGIVFLALFIAPYSMKASPQDISLEKYEQIIQDKLSEGNKTGAANALNKAGYSAWQQGLTDIAIGFFARSMDINRDLGNKNAIKTLASNIGMLYTDKENYLEALKFFNLSQLTSRELKDKSSICYALINKGIAYQGLGRYEESNQNLEEALGLARELNDISLLKSCYSTLAENNEILGNKEKSFEYFQLAASLTKHMQKEKMSRLEYQKKEIEAQNQAKEKQIKSQQDTLKRVMEINKERQMQIKLLNQEKQLQELAIKEHKARQRELEIREKNRKMAIFFLVGGFALLLVFFFLIYRQFRAKKKANLLLAKRNHEIQLQKEETERQRDIANKERKKVTSSIKYAQRIQDAILPPDNYMQGILPNHFILFKPRDIVSGDFYWMTEKEGVVIVVAVDCTGHGVPGAFMSMLGTAFLNEIVNSLGVNEHVRSLRASEILNQLRDHVIEALHQQESNSDTKDGMDVALCIIDMENKKLQFAGAHNPLYIIKDGELNEIRGDRMPIGIDQNHKIPFTNHEIDVNTGDMFYIFSDGFIDQFGGEKGHKFYSKNLKKLLLKIQDKPLAQQRGILDETIEKWKGQRPQVDDILVMGIKATPVPKKKRKPASRYNWDTKRILIAEDTDINYFLLVEALKNTNADVIRAKDGLETVEFCQNNDVDIILMDINMPRMDGFEATREIRRFRKDLPIIAQTAQAQEDDMESCLDAGCNDYISKPVNLNIFLEKIEKLLNG